MKKYIRIHDSDNVAVALSPLEAGEQALGVLLLEPVPAGHKLALGPIASGVAVVKYGLPIGFATEDIAPGAWVHTHNVKTGLSENACYSYASLQPELSPRAPRSFQGYLREEGRAGIRNELWTIPTVGCVNDVCKAPELENAHLAAQYGLDGVFHFPHPYGCSQMGDDHQQTRELLAALCRHPNAGGVLGVGLGCENNKMEEFRVLFGPEYQGKLRYMWCTKTPPQATRRGTSPLWRIKAWAACKRAAPPRWWTCWPTASGSAPQA